MTADLLARIIFYGLGGACVIATVIMLITDIRRGFWSDLRSRQEHRRSMRALDRIHRRYR